MPSNFIFEWDSEKSARSLCIACTAIADGAIAPHGPEKLPGWPIRADFCELLYYNGWMPLLPTDTLPFAEIARRPLDPQECALVVVDIQEKLLPPIHEKERLVSNSRLLVRAAQILSLPVIITTQYAKGLGATVPEIAELVPHVTTLDKLEFGCFGNR